MSATVLEWRREAARLAPYARASLARAEGLARRLHAEELVPEHWLAALLADEDCGATRIVLHAFADPATIGVEVLALCPGIMVVGSGRTLPFSMRALAALRNARVLAAARGAASLEPGDLCLAASRELDARVAARLAPLEGTDLAAAGEAAAASGPALAVPTRSLFKNYTQAGLRALGASARGGHGRARGHRARAPRARLPRGRRRAARAHRSHGGASASRLRRTRRGRDAAPGPRSDRQPGTRRAPALPP
ncbi:MAG: hypothetical protein ABL998_07845 [Planctomycetota bacterium]